MTNNSSPCKCDKCGTVANSIASTTHRRCSSKPGAPAVAKHAPRASGRGRWQVAQ